MIFSFRAVSDRRNKKLRVGYYVSTTFTGGMERHVLTLIDKLNPEKCDVVVFCAFSEWLAPFFDELKRRRVRLYTTDGEGQRSKLAEDRGSRGTWMRPLPWILRRFFLEEAARQIAIELPWILSVRAKLAGAKLDVIHFHAGRLIPLYWPLIASRLVRVPTRLLTLHNAAKRRRPLVGAIERLALSGVHCVITPSEYIQQSLLKYRRIIPQKATVIPHGIELPAWTDSSGRTEARRELGLPADTPVVGTVGRLVYLKGHDLLIRAAPALRAGVPEVKIVVIGDGPQMNALRRLAEEQGVPDIVVFAGYRSHARRLVQAFDVLAVPSREEGFSLSIMEAMSYQRPVVAANVGGIPTLIDDRVTGLLIPPEDVPALAQALIRLLADPKEAEEIGKAGRERVRTHFPLESMLAKIFSLYHPPAGSFPGSASGGATLT